MATTPVQIPLEEYLTTVYRPDCDYIDGEVLERNMGETPHSRLQTFFGFFFRLHEDKWPIEVLIEQRLQVGPKNYRIPDVMLVALPNLDLRIVRTPPLLCIEILSSEDHMREIQKRLNDYGRIGVKTMWVIDPWRRTAHTAGFDAKLHEATDRLTVEGTGISITVDEIFAELDRLEKRSATPKP
jgi:Uma2 family endonuclease